MIQASRILRSVFVLVIVCSFSSGAFALDEQVMDAFPTAERPPGKELIKQEKEYRDWEARGISVDGYADVQQGYDNNVDLDSDRHKDGFLQMTGELEFELEPTDDLKLTWGSDVFSIIYYQYNSDNLLDVSPYFKIDYKITPTLISKNKIIYDCFMYPNQGENSFNGFYLESFLRQYLYPNVYHEAGFEYLWRWFQHQRIYLENAREGNADRFDKRFRINYNIGVYADKYFIRLSNQISKNDSNDRYQAYYDYVQYRLRPAIMYFFTDKFYTDVSFTYRYRRYKDRRSTEIIERREQDHNYIVTGALYYDLTKNITLEAVYSYTENQSNDPFQKYSGNTVVVGAYYGF
ncbi:hypothetical protein ACFL4E_01460 [Candidatus Omnitrophota bacterium]